MYSPIPELVKCHQCHREVDANPATHNDQNQARTIAAGVNYQEWVCLACYNDIVNGELNHEKLS